MMLAVYMLNKVLNHDHTRRVFEYKKSEDLPQEQQMITSCPDVYTWVCTPGDIVVLACDGIFDVLTTSSDLKHNVFPEKASRRDCSLV